jgi:hypothetical protein
MEIWNMTSDSSEELAALRKRVEALEQQLELINKSQYLPVPPFPAPTPEIPFMSFSTPCVADLMHPRYIGILSMMKLPFMWSRKCWEYTFVIHRLLESGRVKPGSRGLVFGVGKERLPAVFAGMGSEIVASDAPIDGCSENEWTLRSLAEIRFTDIVDGEVFDSKVSCKACNMNDIQPELAEFDFNWSCSCFQHLGSIEAGMQFVINAVEKTLRVGGVGVHTTELNLSSNTTTIEGNDLVLYRRRDIEELVKRLRDRGHFVNPFIVAPASHYHDFQVTLPPYDRVKPNSPHLKFLWGDHVFTSVGIVVKRGR